MQRVYSSAPDLFPSGGTKPVPEGNWVDRVVAAKIPVLFVGAAEIRTVFQNHHDILAHGVHAILNIPVIRDACCVGSVNCLYVANPAPRTIQSIAKSIAEILDDIWR